MKRFLGLNSSPSRYLFLCHCENDSQAASVGQSLRTSFVEAPLTGDWEERLHFGTKSVQSMSNWLPALFQEWNSSVRYVEANYTAESTEETALSLKRVDGHFGWLPHVPSEDQTFVGKFVSDVCNQTGNSVAATESSSLAFFIPWTSQCSFATMLQNAESLGAAVAVLYTDGPLREITCVAEECDISIAIPATMVNGEGALEIAKRLERNETVAFKFKKENSLGRSFAIDSQGLLQQNGWPVWPWLSSLAWSAQYLNFQKRVNAEDDKVEMQIEIFDGTAILNGELVGNVSLGESMVELLKESDSVLELDMALGCTGKFDYECPEWDHVLQLFVCCGDVPENCQACPQLVWLEPDLVAESSDTFCGPEVGRWMTPFRRRVGHWLTDISAMKGAILQNLTESTTCRFKIQSVNWAATGQHFWYPTLTLRVGTSGQSEGIKSEPTNLVPEVIPLYGSKTFDKHFNHRLPFFFRTPPDVWSAHIHALITGHGYDNNGCAEFCSGITNHFLVNGKEFKLEFQNAGTQLGCTNEVVNGSEPNEHGTWFYGRNGWCDGMNVNPWIIDITALVKPAGEINLIEYVGLYNGSTPNPTSNPGQILMSSYLILDKFPHTRGDGGKYV